MSPGLDSDRGADGLQDPQRDPARPEGIQLPVALLAAVEALLNRYLALDPEGARGFEPTHGDVEAYEARCRSCYEPFDPNGSPNGDTGGLELTQVMMIDAAKKPSTNLGNRSQMMPTPTVF